MDNQAYLDQITQSTQADISGKKPFFSPMVIRLLIGGVFLAILIIVIGSIWSGMNNKAEDLSKQLSVRLANVTESINTYNPSIKSSQLKSKGTSTKSILTDTKRKLDEELEKTYGWKKPDEKSKMFTDEKSLSDKLNTELEKAKLNALLDRTYIHQLPHQIELILSMESEINTRTKNDQLKSIMQESMKSLADVRTSLDAVADTVN